MTATARKNLSDAVASKAERLLRAREVQGITGWSRATLWRRTRDGSFPKQVQTSPGCVRWRESEVDAWLAALPRAA